MGDNTLPRSAVQSSLSSDTPSLPCLCRVIIAATSCKEAVLQYCQSHDAPPPEESSGPDGFFLRLTGEITFYDSSKNLNDGISLISYGSVSHIKLYIGN